MSENIGFVGADEIPTAPQGTQENIGDKNNGNVVNEDYTTPVSGR